MTPDERAESVITAMVVNMDETRQLSRYALEGIRTLVTDAIRQAVLEEREACAQVCEQTDENGEGPDCWCWHSMDYARAIRSRP